MNEPTVTIPLDLDRVVRLQADEPLRVNAGWNSTVYVVEDHGAGPVVTTIRPIGPSIEIRAVTP